MIELFLRELERFIDKYIVMPSPDDTEATNAYWDEVAKALVAWYNKYDGKEHGEAYHRLQEGAFTALEELWKERER